MPRALAVILAAAVMAVLMVVLALGAPSLASDESGNLISRQRSHREAPGTLRGWVEPDGTAELHGPQGFEDFRGETYRGMVDESGAASLKDQHGESLRGGVRDGWVRLRDRQGRQYRGQAYPDGKLTVRPESAPR